MGLIKPDAARSDLNYMISMGDSDVMGPQGLPLTKPPYRRITAIDLNKGDFAWQVPLGDGPKDHPAIKHLNLGPLGAWFPEGVLAESGNLVTKDLLITHIADVDELGDRQAHGSFLLAFDKATGELLHQIKVERTLHGPPVTYMHEGKQYILIEGGGVSEPSELMAFALPN